jgi:hypothetical protein
MRSFFSVFVTLALAITVAGSAVPACYDTESDEVTFALSVVGEQAVGPEVIVNPDDEAMILDWKSDVINTHNNARAHYGAGKVTWSDALYPGTLEWAKQCQFKHSNGHYGENLAAGSGSNYGFSNGFKDWMDESKGYNYNEDFQAGKGHFTQVVWKGSHQVACAIANCAPGTIFGQASKNIVCRYSPQGNIIGHFRENVGRPQ